jgi:hypothetical protein
LDGLAAGKLEESRLRVHRSAARPRVAPKGQNTDRALVTNSSANHSISLGRRATRSVTARTGLPLPKGVLNQAPGSSSFKRNIHAHVASENVSG